MFGSNQYLPKELAVKPLPASQGLQFIDLAEFCASIPESTASPEVISKKIASLVGITASPRTGVAFADALSTGNLTNSVPGARRARPAATANGAPQPEIDVAFDDFPASPATSLANTMGSLMQTPYSVMPPPAPEGLKSLITKSSFRINVSNVSTTTSDGAGGSTITATVLKETAPPDTSKALTPTPAAKRFGRSQSEKIAATSPKAGLKDMGLATVAPSASTVPTPAPMPAPAPVPVPVPAPAPAPAPAQLAATTASSAPAPDTAAKSEVSAAFTDSGSVFDTDDYYTVQRSPAPSPGDNLYSKYGKKTSYITQMKFCPL